MMERVGVALKNVKTMIRNTPHVFGKEGEVTGRREVREDGRKHKCKF